MIIKKCTTCGAELDDSWDAATVHVDPGEGITCGGRLYGVIDRTQQREINMHQEMYDDLRGEADGQDW